VSIQLDISTLEILVRLGLFEILFTLELWEVSREEWLFCSIWKVSSKPTPVATVDLMAEAEGGCD